MRETRNYFTTQSNYADHTTFGGLIYPSDFNTDYRGNDQKESSIAKRIASDWKFDQQCKQTIKNRKRFEKIKDDKNK